MNNQAAQTMPSVDAFMAKWEWLILSRCRDEFVADLAALSQTAGVPSWIVNDLGELGVMVNGVAYFLYKGDNIVYEDAKHDDGSPMLYRMVGKREFGEVCHPRHWEKSGWAAAHRYTQELVYTPGLSFGKPEDGDWRPLPAKGAAPPASGVHPDALPDGTLSKSTSKRVEVLAAASVSERARELADEWRHVLDDGEDGHELCASRNTVARFVNAIDALEQALTQQRGECYCQSCKGSGEVIGLHASPSGDPQDAYEAPMACPKCDGTGDAK